MAYDIVSFDLDGTLVDTASEIAEAANCALLDHGIARRPVAEITRYIGLGTYELMEQLLAAVMAERLVLPGTIATPALHASMARHYMQVTGTQATTYPGCRDALQRLTDAGVRLACVTNKESRLARRVLQANGLERYFELTIGGDTLPCKKPDASVLQHVLERLGGVAARAAHVGDSATDVAAARNAGVAAWAVPYGYNAGRPISESAPEKIFPGLSDVADHVLGLRAGALA
jgi:phosphoglycolate phosphatase